MTTTNAVVVLTGRGKSEIIKTGGSQAWRLDAGKAGKRNYVVCVQNRNITWGTAEAEHHHAFLVGKISSVTRTNEGKGDRWIINIDAYADIDIAEQWDGNRNPVSYRTLESMSIDVNTLNFKPVRELKETSELPLSNKPSLTIAEAKKGLALEFGVTEDQVNITISA